MTGECCECDDVFKRVVNDKHRCPLCRTMFEKDTVPLEIPVHEIFQESADKENFIKTFIRRLRR